MGPSWGITIARDFIEGVVLEDNFSPRLLKKMRIASEIDKGYYHILGQIHKLVEVLSTEISISPAMLGVGCPGNIDPITKTLKNTGIKTLEGKPLRSDLETYLGLNVRVASTAKCFTLAETRFGTTKDVLPSARCTVGILLDDTVDAGIVVNGRILSGRQNIAGTWGHNYLDEDGGRCSCGNHGCVESIIGRKALENYYNHLTGVRRSLEQIAKRAEGGHDSAAAQTIERYVYNFARAIGPFINILDPDSIVVGGAARHVNALYEQGPDLIKRFVSNSRLDTLIFRPRLEENSGVFGAALL